jgi:hypothetical protein
MLREEGALPEKDDSSAGEWRDWRLLQPSPVHFGLIGCEV